MGRGTHVLSSAAFGVRVLDQCDTVATASTNLMDIISMLFDSLGVPDQTIEGHRMSMEPDIDVSLYIPANYA